MQNIHCAAQTVYDMLTRKAAKEEKEKNVKNGNVASNLTVSGDGTWKKRGFSSFFNITTLIGLYCNKVIDTEVKSSFCQECNIWKNKSGTVEYANWKASHEDNCTNNYEGSAGKVEVEAIKDMFLRLIKKYEVKYTIRRT